MNIIFRMRAICICDQFHLQAFHSERKVQLGNMISSRLNSASIYAKSPRHHLVLRCAQLDNHHCTLGFRVFRPTVPYRIYSISTICKRFFHPCILQNATCTSLYKKTMSVKISLPATPLVYPARLVFPFQQYSRSVLLLYPRRPTFPEYIGKNGWRNALSELILPRFEDSYMARLSLLG